jgi:hypothetical protein
VFVTSITESATGSDSISGGVDFASLIA